MLNRVIDVSKIKDYSIVHDIMKDKAARHSPWPDIAIANSQFLNMVDETLRGTGQSPFTAQDSE
jgi:hypothetical protein